MAVNEGESQVSQRDVRPFCEGVRDQYTSPVSGASRSNDSTLGDLDGGPVLSRERRSMGWYR